jgi:hypothetical protein
VHETALSGLLPERKAVGSAPHHADNGVIYGNLMNMAKKEKKKLTSAQKAARKKRQQKYMTVFMNGKQKRVKRPATIDGMEIDKFIEINADPIFLHQNEMWECIGDYEDEWENDAPACPKNVSGDSDVSMTKEF